ncbi:kinase-like domain-containing protein [Phlyctochytrium arcticum]|nr:kinase-like domain-containing protein [Phlyctochytrium arcticum]
MSTAKSKWDSEDEEDSRARPERSQKRRKQTGKGTGTSIHIEDQPDQIQQAPPVPPIPINPPRRRLVGPPLVSCRCVDTFEKLNRIEEGAYGVVYRARDRETGEIVALKRLKLEKEVNGFPVTSLREIHTLLLAKHPNIVNVKEIVVTPSMRGVFIVMEFVEHDLKSLMESMPSPFLQSEIKTLMIQLLSAVALLHQNWIIHRDLKTSNLLMNNQGQIKVADFGLARRFGSPLGPVTQLVVTLWYRAPELLLGAKEYTTAIDMWSIGCIFGELVNKEPLLQGRGEIDQLKKIFQLLGTPNERIWPSMKSLPGCKTFSFVNQPYNNLRSRFSYLTENGLDLMSKLLTYDPEKRISAEDALRHPYFSEQPLPKDPSMFPTFPSKGAGEKRKVYASPSAPKASHGDGGRSNDGDDTGHPGLFDAVSAETSGAGFRLKV